MAKGLPWFRMYTDFLEDPKLISLAFEDQRHFIAILALKSSGLIDQECADNVKNRLVAQRLWVDYAIIADVKKRLFDAGLIDENWQPVAWEKRQFSSDRDPTGAERQKKYRENQRLAERNALRNAPSNASVTLPDTDTDTDTDKKRKNKSPSADIEFELMWTEYPKRPGANKSGTLKNWNARLKDGADPQAMIEGVKSYANYCRLNRIEPNFIKQPVTFFGTGKHYECDWGGVASSSSAKPSYDDGQKRDYGTEIGLL